MKTGHANWETKTPFDSIIDDMKSGKIPMEHTITLDNGTKVNLRKTKVTISSKGITMTKRKREGK